MSVANSYLGSLVELSGIKNASIDAGYRLKGGKDGLSGKGYCGPRFFS